MQIAASKATSVRQLLHLLGLREAGGNYKQIAKYLKEYNICTQHFRGKSWNKGLTGFKKPRISTEQILVDGSTFQSYKLKKRLFETGIKKPACELCGWAKITNDGRTPVELHHINGKNNDNRIGNLQILCPNCHSLQPTHRGKNIKT